jgi:hypothetical protein
MRTLQTDKPTEPSRPIITSCDGAVANRFLNENIMLEVNAHSIECAGTYCGRAYFHTGYFHIIKHFETHLNIGVEIRSPVWLSLFPHTVHTIHIRAIVPLDT